MEGFSVAEQAPWCAPGRLSTEFHRKGRVLHPDFLCIMCGEQRDTVTCFLSEYFGLPVSTFPLNLFIDHQRCTFLTVDRFEMFFMQHR